MHGYSINYKSARIQRSIGSTLKRCRIFGLVLAVLGAALTTVRATVAVSPLYGNNMVIQRGKPFPVWGTATPNTAVTASYNGQTNSVTSDASGNWRLTLPSMSVQATGSNFIIKEAGGNTITFGNVVVGDVWLCSGQSNMGIDVDYCLENGNETGTSTNPDVTTANFSGMRLFGSVPYAPAGTPTTTFNGGVNWAVCSPSTVGTFSAVAFYFGRTIYTNQNGNIPIGLIESQVGGTTIDLWLDPEGLTDIPVLAPLYSQSGLSTGPFSLFNGMIYPLAPYPVKGVIWYQGENAEQSTQSADSYYLKQKGLIDGWKQLLGLDDCAFYLVQIANSGTAPTSPAPVLQSGGWNADTRLQQGFALNLPHAGVASAIDIGNSVSWVTNAWLGWHPTNKWDVGFRLGLWAMKNEYGQTNLVTSGPVLRDVTVAGSTATCTFDYAGSGLMVGYKLVYGTAYPTNSPLSLFSIAGADGTWYWANATITGSNTLQLTSTNVTTPLMVAYACWQNPAGVNLYNSNGLPALPFYVANINTKYTVTASTGAGGGISPASAVSYLQRMTALYTITPNPGYYVQNIQVDGTNVGPVSFHDSVAYYTFDPLYANHTITATFTNALPTNTITATASGGGTLTPAGVIRLAQGASQLFDIAANPGFQAAVTVDGEPMGPRNNFNFAGLAVNHTLAVAFTTTINASAGYGGAISPPGVTNITYGSSATYVISPATGYAILKVTVDGISVGAATSYTFTNVTTAHTITASFTGGTPGGSVPQTNNLLFSCLVDSLQTNSSGTITSWPASIPVYPALSPMGSPSPTLAVLDNRPFAQNYYVSSPAGFNAGAYSSPIPCSGASIVVVAKPVRNGINSGFDCVVDAFYNQLSIGVLNDSGQVVVLLNGSMGTSTATIPDGQTTILSLVVQPNGQYGVWANGALLYTNSTVSPLTSLVNGVAGSFANNISIGNDYPDGWSTYNGYIGDIFFYTNALSNTNRALLEQYLATRLLSGNANNYTITATAGTGGTITPAGGVLVASGSNQNFTITASTGYSISSVIVDGVSQGAISSYTFNNVTTNHTISALFAYNGHTITATAGTGGIITPSGAVPVAAGAEQSFTISANAGGAVTNVVVDGVSQGAVTSYTFTNVTANHTIAAAFSYTNYTITATAGTGGLINPAGGVQVGYGSNQLFTVTASPGYAISNVVADGVSQGAISSYTFTNVIADHTIAAMFNLVPMVGGIISVNFGGGTANVTKTVGAVAAANWNNLLGVANPTSSALVESNGALTTMSLSTSGFNGASTFGNGNGAGGLSDMYNGYLELDYNNSGSATISLSIIPFTSYDIYIYYEGYTANVGYGSSSFSPLSDAVSKWTVSERSQTLYGQGGDNGGGANLADAWGYNLTGSLHQFQSATAPAQQPSAPNGAGGDYLKFTGLTAATQTITLTGISGNGFESIGIAGLQIVQSIVVVPTYTITPSAGTGGTISPGTPQAVTNGNNAAFTIMANTGYSISNVVVDGVSQGAIGNYTFTNVMATHTISATFAVAPPLLSAANLTLPGGIPTFTMANSLSGHQYTLVYKNSLTDPNWIPLTGLGSTAGTGGNINLSDTNSIYSSAQRFYRIQMQ